MTRGGPRASEPLAALLPGLESDSTTVGVVQIPSRPGVRASWPDWLDPRVRDAYERRGISRPWGHQVRAAALAWSGQHVALATGTASGKSAAFGMPGLTTALRPAASAGSRGPCVLYVAPTKALAHDQLAGLESLRLPGLRAAALDGDTADDQRRWARSHARWIVTNPDMLHRSILPGHERWAGFLREVSLVVIDESHVYRGVFGAHVALVLRRLRRVAGVHGADPTFFLASATMADAAETSERLIGAPVEAVEADDSSRGPVTLVLRRPDPLSGSGSLAGAEPGSGTEPGAGAQRPSGGEQEDEGPKTALEDAVTLVSGLVDAGVRTLAFTRSRRGAEILAAQVRATARAGTHVRAYRGGYLPEERRALEADLREGRLLGLAATSALELGIDISGLDAVVLTGWPGTRASFWQQVGRAGRAGGDALAVLVAREDPLDRYFVDHPSALVSRPVEASVFDPANPYVLAGHLCAAAAESPLRDQDVDRWFGADAPSLCEALANQGMLRRRRDGWYWTGSTRPADLVDIRGTGGGPVRVVEECTGQLLGTVDAAGAPAAVHPGAIYVHQGATFEVLSLDLDGLVATARGISTDLSTHAHTATDVTIEIEHDRQTWHGVAICVGEVLVTSQVTSFLVRRWPGGQVLGEHPLDLPANELPTQAVWLTIPESVIGAADIPPTALAGALHALEHAAIAMLPLLATCDRWDIGGVSTALHPQTDSATIVVYDGHPGGAGFARMGFDSIASWLAVTLDAITRCACRSGCPACIQSPKCGNGNEPLDKEGAARLARAVLEQGTESGHVPRAEACVQPRAHELDAP